MFGIDKDFQNLMEQLYGPLNKDKEPPDTIEFGGVKYKRVEEPKPLTLYNRLYDVLGYDFDTCNDIVDLVEDWLPKEHDTNSDGWNKCVRMLRENLR